MLKLAELNPRWTGLPGPVVDGLTFECPHCRQLGKQPAQRLGITFSPPIDPEKWWDKITQPSYLGINVWKRGAGETFDTLTLTPSVNTRIDVVGHWHGFITNGCVITAG